MPSLADLTDAQRDFLSALRAGKSGREYARQRGYSVHWAKWISGEIRDRLGVTTILEAVAMSETTAEDLAEIRKELRDLREAQERLEKARTPAAKEEAREDVREAKADLDAELRQRGLSRADLDKLQEDKEYERFKARQSRYETERESEREADEEAKKAAKPKPRKVAGAEPEAEPEEPPESQHWADRPLWGRKDDAA